MEKQKAKLRGALSSLDGLKWSVALKGIIAGSVAGLASVLYRIVIETCSDVSRGIYAYLRQNPPMIFLWIIVIGLAGWAIGWMVKKEPMASGSGIPQVEGVLFYGLKMRSYLILVIRFIGGALAALFGLSVGREGPSIQIGAAAGELVSKIGVKSKLEKHMIITGGAAAGLSAAFSAPISGMVFALEEIHRSFSPYILLVAASASLTADIISKIIFGLKPVLYFVQIPELPINLYIWLLPAAAVFGLSGSLMNKMLLWVQSLYKKLPWYLQIFAALLIALPFGLFLPQVLGGGANLIQLAESVTDLFGFIALLFICKIIFTSTSFGSGVPGGIFMPILAAGALSGSLFGMIASHFGLPLQYIPVFAVCGMAGAFASSVKAPVTGILLIAEMTGSMIHLLPVGICAYIALLLSDMLKIKPIYEELLKRYMGSGKALFEEEKGKLFELPVEAGSCISNELIKNVALPSGCLIIGIRRGTKEIIPHGNTRVLPGDYLLVLAGANDPDSVREAMRKLCQFD